MYSNFKSPPPRWSPRGECSGPASCLPRRWSPTRSEPSGRRRWMSSPPPPEVLSSQIWSSWCLGSAFPEKTGMVGDPHCRHFSNCGSGSQCGSGSRVLMTKNWKKFTTRIFNLFLKLAINLSLGLPKGRPSYRRSLQPTKKEHPALQNMKFLYFFLFCWSYLHSWIRIHQLKLMRIHADPDLQSLGQGLLLCC